MSAAAPAAESAQAAAAAAGGAPVAPGHGTQPAAAARGPSLVTAFSDPLLKFFYDHLFPYKEMVEWLCYGHHPESKSKLADKTFFKRREISFTLKGDVYARYKSFANKDEFREAIRSKCPYKIDIGAVYNYPPEQRNAVSKFITLSRELVFDIDMTDYALVKSCCSMLCPRCWPLMVCAIKVLDRILRIDLGFKHILWVYSGRRGVHCWVADERARLLSNEVRSGIVRYVALSLGTKDNRLALAPQLTVPLMPALQAAFNLLERPFVDIQVEEMGLFDTAERWKSVLEFIPDEEIRTKLSERWQQRESSGFERWVELKKTVEADARRTNKKALRKVVPHIVLEHTYPRIDVNVSTQMQHLLKSPFCVHPTTGRVCVPIDDVDTFSPFDAPSLESLKRELDALPALQIRSEDERLIEQTSLRRYVDFFRSRFVAPILREIAQSRREEAARLGDSAFGLDD